MPVARHDSEVHWQWAVCNLNISSRVTVPSTPLSITFHRHLRFKKFKQPLTELLISFKMMPVLCVGKTCVAVGRSVNDDHKTGGLPYWDKQRASEGSDLPNTTLSTHIIAAVYVALIRLLASPPDRGVRTDGFNDLTAFMRQVSSLSRFTAAT